MKPLFQLQSAPENHATWVQPSLPDSLLEQYDLNTCLLMAEYFDKAAAQCRARAAQLNQKEAQTRRTTGHLESIEDAGKIAHYYTLQGSTRSAAIDATAAMTGHPKLTVEAALKRVEKNIAELKKNARDMDILRLRNAGWSNPRIAERHQLTVSQVGRVLKKMAAGNT